MIVEGTLEDPEPVLRVYLWNGRRIRKSLFCISVGKQLFNACLELLQYEFEITSIPKSDYDLISEHAFFLVNSYQVL